MKKTPLRDLKQRRLAWIEMIHQLRFGSPTTPEINPGDCQQFFDFLLQRSWPFDEPCPVVRHWNHLQRLESIHIKNLVSVLPEWLQDKREAHGFDDAPIFYRKNSQLVYIDGRRRILSLYKKDSEQFINVWVLQPDPNPLNPFLKKDKPRIDKKIPKKEKQK